MTSPWEGQQPVAEGLRAVVQRERSRAVAAGRRILLRDLVAVAVADLLVVVAYLVVQLDRLAERAVAQPKVAVIGGAGPPDDGLPARPQRLAGVARVPVRRTGRLHHEGAEEAVPDRRAVAGARMDGVRTLEGGLVRDVEAVRRHAAGRRAARHVRPHGIARGAHREREAVHVHAEVPAGGSVAVADREAVTFVGPDDQGLDRVVAQTTGHGPAALLGAHRRDVLAEDVHLAGRVVVAEPVERDVDVEHRNVEGLVGDPPGQALLRRRDSRLRSRRHHQQAGPAGQGSEQRHGGRYRDRPHPHERSGRSARAFRRRPRQGDEQGRDQDLDRQDDPEVPQDVREGAEFVSLLASEEDLVGGASGAERGSSRHRRARRDENAVLLPPGTRRAQPTNDPAGRVHRGDHRGQRQGAVAQPVR